MFLIFLRDLKKERRDEDDFLQAFNHQAFLQVDTILVEIANHAQSTKKSKFAKSLQYLKKEVRDELTFCADKHQSFLQVNTITFDGRSQAFPKYSK